MRSDLECTLLQAVKTQAFIVTSLCHIICYVQKSDSSFYTTLQSSSLTSCDVTLPPTLLILNEQWDQRGKC